MRRHAFLQLVSPCGGLFSGKRRTFVIKNTEIGARRIHLSALLQALPSPLRRRAGIFFVPLRLTCQPVPTSTALGAGRLLFYSAAISEDLEVRGSARIGWGWLPTPAPTGGRTGVRWPVAAGSLTPGELM